jgi:hypothetical protein
MSLTFARVKTSLKAETHMERYAVTFSLTRGKLIGQEGEEQAKRYIFVVRRKGKAGHCDV